MYTGDQPWIVWINNRGICFQAAEGKAKHSVEHEEDGHNERWGGACTHAHAHALTHTHACMPSLRQANGTNAPLPNLHCFAVLARLRVKACEGL